MTIFCDKLYAEMYEALRLLSYESISELQKIKQSIVIVRSHLQQLNEFIKDYEFADKEEEIRYFKQFRPMFSKELFYYTSLFDIEIYKPAADPQTVKDYYKDQITLLNSTLQKFHFLYQYYILGENHMDERLFIRDAEGVVEMPLFSAEIDNRVSNAYSIKLAELQAIEDLVAHLNGNMTLIERGPVGDSISTSKLPRVFWKGSKAQFYELVYALVDSESVTGNLKQAMEWMAYCLNVKPGNFYGYHQMMRIRKKNRAPFLDRLKTFFLIHMDDNDENPRFQ